MKFIQSITIIISSILLCFCSNKHNTSIDNNSRTIIDFTNRTVQVPDTVARVVCIRPGCIKLVIMAGGINHISGIEDTEKGKLKFIHTIAYPELLEKEVIGPRFGGDNELIYSNHPDVIFMSTTTAEAADALQAKLNIPVIVIEGGDFGSNYWKFCKSMGIIGNVLGTTQQVDTLLSYINNEKIELNTMTSGLDKVNAYIGAITYKGERDLTATDPYYSSLQFINVHNVASEIDSSIVSPITGTFIDYEQIIKWNPDFIFVDRGGVAKADECFMNKPQLNNLLKAYRNSDIYVVWPYNGYHHNYDVLLLNAWYMAKCIYPSKFKDVSMRNKGNELFTMFYGKPIYDELCNEWSKYQQLDYQSKNINKTEWHSLNE